MTKNKNIEAKSNKIKYFSSIAHLRQAPAPHTTPEN